MKRILFIALILIAALKVFTACEFNRSVHKDLKTGALSGGDGIGCENISIEVNGTKDRRNTFVFGEKVNFVFDDLTGFTEKDGKKFPGLSLHIVKNEKDTVLAYANLLDHLEDGTALSPLQLQASFTAALPHKDHEKYKVHINIWDEKGTGQFSYEMPFTVTGNDFLDIETSGATYDNIYLWDQTGHQLVTDKTINADHSFVLIVEGADGFKQTEGVVFPVFSIEITDRRGNILLSDANLFKKYEDTGLDADTFNDKLYATIGFYGGKVHNPCKLKAVLKDQHSEKQIAVTTELEIR
ncbi:hypothetical protein LS482_15270 [Sinomicrobium kalidii]|uniref:hypothetical protein n=1 Tax=Sinomicrobium kalidii TaxID=2900738 RepID=UPI001E3E4D91|nr:hypothetical protein [Sinomicrobium kalidii]UGU15038.1 hypothetical protein LS482_15270 [Sinomicrobium kalidii]